MKIGESLEIVVENKQLNNKSILTKYLITKQKDGLYLSYQLKLDKSNITMFKIETIFAKKEDELLENVVVKNYSLCGKYEEGFKFMFANVIRAEIKKNNIKKG